MLQIIKILEFLYKSCEEWKPFTFFSVGSIPFPAYLHFSMRNALLRTQPAAFFVCNTSNFYSILPLACWSKQSWIIVTVTAILDNQNIKSSMVTIFTWIVVTMFCLLPGLFHFHTISVVILLLVFLMLRFCMNWQTEDLFWRLLSFIWRYLQSSPAPADEGNHGKAVESRQMSHHHSQAERPRHYQSGSKRALWRRINTRRTPPRLDRGGSNHKI